MDVKIVVLDTETTGGEAPHGVCEIAFAELDLQNLDIVDMKHSLIDPQKPITYNATAIHGYYYEDVANSPTLDEYFSDVLGNPYHDVGVYFVAHNAKYDLPLVAAHFPNIIETVCTLRLAKRFLPNAEAHNLPCLKAEFRLDGGTSHKADGDVLTCVSLLKLLCQTTGKSVAQMQLEAQQPLAVKVMPFGKHKGVLMTQLDVGYCKWALGPSGLKEIDDDLRFTFEQRLAGKLS